VEHFGSRYQDMDRPYREGTKLIVNNLHFDVSEDDLLVNIEKRYIERFLIGFLFS
jgi:hypothetical protein